MTALLLKLPTIQRTPWTLKHASTLALEQHWTGLRCYDQRVSWCNLLRAEYPDRTLATLTTQDIQAHIVGLRARGLGDWTVHARVCVIATLYDVAKRNGYDGPVPTIPRPNVKKPLKWWLTPEKEQEVVRWLRTQGKRQMAYYIAWTVLTGLRVEETLRVHSGHFQGLLSSTPTLTVPGTKTEGSQAALALSPTAAQLAVVIFTATGRDMSTTCAIPLFPISLWSLQNQWQSTREHFGWVGDSTATLKALRRSFARRVFANGAPLPIVQGMMRHKDPQTTLGYLRLVGGAFTTEEQRKWL